MHIRPVKSNTIVDQFDWKPATFSDLLEEISYLSKTTASPLLYRGQQSSDYLLDTTYARRLKGKYNLNVTDRYPEHLIKDGKFQRELTKRYLDGLWQVPIFRQYVLGKQLLIVEGKPIDVAYQALIQEQQGDVPDSDIAKYRNDSGTNFLDFTSDSNVGLFFAMDDKKPNNNAALFIVFWTNLGPIFRRNETPASEILCLLQSEIDYPTPKKYCSLPRLPWPLAQSLSLRRKRQQAEYLVQVDLTEDFEYSWKEHYKKTGKQAFMKIFIKSEWEEEIRIYLNNNGLTKEFLYER